MPKYLNSIRPFVGVYAALLLLVVLSQYLGGVYANEFGQYPDEPAHYVTGLMVHDFLARFQFDSPLSFAEDFYLHYPKVAIGHWPPFFYAIQALWTLAFPASRPSLLILMAMITALLGTTVFAAMRREFGDLIAVFAGITLLGLPLVQEFTGVLMIEILLTLLCFWATLRFGQFLEYGQTRDAVSFGVLASLAILTKGNGWLLLLVPPLGVLLARRFDLTVRGAFWYPALIVSFACVPWYSFTLPMVQNGWYQQQPSLEYTLQALGFFLKHFPSVTGLWPVAFAAIGLIAEVIAPLWQRQVKGPWAAVSALLLSGLIFHSVVPASLEVRHLLVIAPPFVMFVVAGVNWLVMRFPLPSLDAKQKGTVLVFLGLLVFLGQTFTRSRSDWYGFGSVAQRLLSTPAFSKSIFLISSDSRGEGAFIAEVGRREKRPGHIVLRGTKVLAGGDWSGRDYYSFYSTPRELMNYLEEVPVGVVVLDLSLPESKQLQHQGVLQQAIEGHPEIWQFVDAYALMRDGVQQPNAIQVYQRKSHETDGGRNIRIPMHRMLGRDIEAKN